MKNANNIRFSRKTKLVAVMLMNIFAYQLVFPNIAMALTSGPTQPEVQGFEPVGTTDMVDMFSGSFVYNIPLMDVEGYPVNISYHGGVSMEQEASWVGLGWNINPGVINRTVRGVPDDFNGDTIHKDFNIRGESTLRVGVGAGAEWGGIGDPKLKGKLGLSANFGPNINISNYKGVSADLSFGGGINVFGVVSTGVNFGVGSQTGASVDYNAALSFSSSKLVTKHETGASVGLNAAVGGGYSSRSGVKDLNLSVSASIQSNWHNNQTKEGTNEKGEKVSITEVGHAGSGGLFSSGASIPIGCKNYVPVITNSSTMSTIYGRIKVGGEAFGGYGYGNVSAMYNMLSFANDASRRSYGYMYLQNAGIDNVDVLDFTRDKDGMFNKNMEYLPVPHMTYDIYSLSGQGTGGMFRPFRNDFGSVHDPFTTSTGSGNHGEGEIGVGNVFEAGLDYTNTSTTITSGPWGGYQRSGTTKGFVKNTNGSVFENVYFKQGGELSAIDPAYFTAIGGEGLLNPEAAMDLPAQKPNSAIRRDPRSNLIYYRTAGELGRAPADVDASGAIVSSSGSTTLGSTSEISRIDYPAMLSYSDPSFTTYGNPAVDTIGRIGRGHFQRKKDQISEIVQVQKDGRKYVYGIAALNNVQREVSFNAAGNTVDPATGIVNIETGDDTKDNHKGKDHFYGSTVTPSYAHSYLLTSVLSDDYVDVTGNGVSDDDLGAYTKFNYTRTDSDFRWIAPFSTDKMKATYEPGFWSDKTDDKGNYLCGSREQWNLHAIETKNFIAEFYTSVRNDARGIGAAILNNAESSLLTHDKPSGYSYSYKLDSIKLYNKHDRFVNGATAVPVKSVFFVYDYSLCPGIPNTATPGEGKLTLSKIYFSYGNSKKSMISPYGFKYGVNKVYDLAAKDRWGNYKPNHPAFTNYEYPYVDQNDPANDEYASAWSLSEISLPSGGIIRANYESNDYAYVQNKPVNEMFMVQGLGKSADFSPGSELYTDKRSPCLFTYFKRRIASESPSLSLMQNYLGADFRLDKDNFIYFNFNVQLTNSTATNEQIKGYARIQEVGVCNDPQYGYVKFQPQTTTGDGASLHPITMTAINVGRYNVPQIVFPGQDPDEDDMHNILAGLKGAFNELFATARNPVVSMVVHSGGKSVNLAKSYIRLQSVGLTKKGGGQRVKSLYFYDQWDALAGGNESGTFYGKQYAYKCPDPVYGEVSSGVASYEAMIGGDENPMRQPMARYSAQSGSQFPPSDAIDLYQESPLGESLYPSAQVGYRQVAVTSVHKDEGRSSKSMDQYEFYTAKDYPVRVVASSIKATVSNYYDFFTQKNDLAGTQSYTLIFNDMHGKPKNTKHYVLKAGKYEPLSYTKYNYKSVGDKLDNNVKCLAYNISSHNMEVQEQQLGVEEDVTFDSREKSEETSNFTYNSNLNFFLIPALPVPIPSLVYYGFPWGNEVKNKFQSAVVAKVIQQYGILESVEAFNEGATTIMHNEIYDALTGQPVVISINNEFQDREYTTNIPASWVYKGMSGAYENIGYRDTGTISVDANYIGALNLVHPMAALTEGDQLAVSFEYLGHPGATMLWVMGRIPEYSSSGAPMPSAALNVLPRYPLATPGWVPGAVLKNVEIKVINSGHKNMLSENVQSYTSMNSPIAGATLATSLTRLIDLKARTYADSNTRIISKYLRRPDTLNPYVIGERGQWRLLSEYAYLTNRDYSGATARNSGLFTANSLFASAFGVPVPPSLVTPYQFLAPFVTDPNWHAMRTITKWSPYGKEVENMDALGNYSTAVFGYNENLPVAVAGNAKQGEVLALGFEDYNLLKARSDTMTFKYYGGAYGGMVPLPGAATGAPYLYRMTNPGITLFGGTITDSTIACNVGHTGTYSMMSRGNSIMLQLPIRSAGYGGIINKYNNYFSSNPVPLAGYQFSAANEYLDFALATDKDYILNYWIRPFKYDASLPDYTYTVDMRVTGSGSVSSAFHAVKKTNIIDGWEQWEVRFKLPAGTTSALAYFSESCYVDDIRIFPASANMKAFVYSPVKSALHATNEKLMSTLDENNFATMYEYDQEGNLVRVKKETSGGIMTVSESRSGNPKK